MTRHPNIVWLVLCKTRRARKWVVFGHAAGLRKAQRMLEEQVRRHPKLDHRSLRVEIPESDVLWIARKK